MSLLRPSEQRCVPVRLIDVPLHERRLGANRAVSDEPDPMERLKIRLLAEWPPPTLVAWIRP